jgi:LacI family transcriptional regulator
LGYSANPIAKSLATGRNRVIGLTLPYDTTFLYPDPWAATVMAGIVAEVIKQGYNLLLYTAAGGHFESELQKAKQPATQSTYDPSKLIDSRVDGLIVILSPSNDAILANCRRAGMPLVSVLRVAKDAEELTVNSNDYEGARLATQHLIDLGHTRIAHIYGWTEVPTTEPRIRGYRDALNENGIEINEGFLLCGDFVRDQGRIAMSQLLALGDDRPTAVFCCNDASAHGAVDAIRDAGLCVPGDISVVGYDDTGYATLIEPPLTTVNMYSEQIGSRAAKLLIAAVEGREVSERQPVLSVSLSVRRSSGPAPLKR